MNQPANLAGPDPGLSEREVGNYFVAVYPPFSAWETDGPRTIESILGRPAPPDLALGLYIHVPFCIHRCQFCYYRSYARPSAESLATYVDAVLHELELYRRQPYLADRNLRFGYFGGGTPSLLPPEQVSRLLQGSRALFPPEAGAELSFECAPGSVSKATLLALHEGGVTRVSMGIQQLDDEVLRRNGRVHAVDAVEGAYEAIREQGFESVNVDLMVGLVGETEESFFRSLERVIELRPDSVTLYPLEIPRNTPLAHALEEGLPREQLATWNVKRDRLRRAFDRLEEREYRLRSAYTAVLDGHGFDYQDLQYRGADLLGAGVSSFSCLSGVHAQNHAGLRGWQEALDAGSLPVRRSHRLSPEERVVRELVLQVKLGRIDVAGIRERHGVDVTKQFADVWAEWTAAGWMEGDRQGIELTREGLLKADRIVERLFLPQHQGAEYW